jgi:hypothetical protein
MLDAVVEERAFLSRFGLDVKARSKGAHRKMGENERRLSKGRSGHHDEEGPVPGLVVPSATLGALASGLMAINLRQIIG